MTKHASTGALITLVIPETKGKTLEEIEEGDIHKRKTRVESGLSSIEEIEGVKTTSTVESMSKSN